MFRLICFLLPAVMLAQDFGYDRSRPVDVRVVSAEMRSGVRVADITFADLGGGRTLAYLVSPPGEGKTAGALFVHWLEEKEPNSNRTEFLDEAVALARGGLTSLLVDAPWSKAGWYQLRDVSRDYEHSVQQVKELRRALDVLLGQPRVDPQRVAYVGHDFGAMYGVVTAAVDHRIRVAAFQAFPSRLGDWFLYNQKQLSAAGREQVLARLSPFDAVRNIGSVEAPVLLQFAKDDFYVPRDEAEAIFRAAKEPKEILWYDAGHGLNAKAAADRQGWLWRRLALR